MKRTHKKVLTSNKQQNNSHPMKAVLLTRHGKKDVLKISDLAEPVVADHEVKVKIETIGLNYAEILSRKGLYGWAPKPPYIPGMEAYGEIVEKGKKVTNRKIGEKVIVGAQYGSYAQYICVPEYQALKSVKNFSPEENAAFAVNFITAYISLFILARLKKSEKVLIHSAAGGVGSAATRLGLAAGCNVFAAAGSEKKVALLMKMGVQHAINYKTEDFEEQIISITRGTGVDVVLELVGGDVFKKSLRVLAPFGRITTAGFSALNLKKWNPVSWIKTYIDLPKSNIQELMHKSLTLSSTHVGYLLDKPELILSIYNEMLAFVTKHKIRPLVGKVFPFEEIQAAHEFIESRLSTGKVVLRIY